MADVSKIFKPRRGTASIMTGTKKSTVLASGELFVEVPNTGVGTGASKIKIGDGTTAYSSLPYALGDTSNDKINFSSNTSTTVAAALNSVVTGASLKNIVAGLKQAISLCNKSITQLNDDFVEQLAGLSFAQNEEGNWGYKPSGADSVIPFKTGSGNYEITITGNISAHFQSNVNRGYSAVTKTFVIVINIIDGVVSYSITTNPVGVGGTWVSLSDIYGSSVISVITGFSITNITIAPL